MSTGKRKRVSLGEKYKAITDLESGLKPSKVAENMMFPEIRYQHGLRKKKKSKVLSNPVKLARKGKI